MSPSVNITRRVRESGSVRYVVRYRLGGGETRPLHGGSFKSKRDAEARARWIAGELAAMRAPDLRMDRPADAPLTVVKAIERWIDSRHDLAPGTRRNYRAALYRMEPLERVRVDDLTPRDVSEWIGTMVTAGTGHALMERCLAALRGALDDLRDPNPARHRSVRLPKLERVEANPPTLAHWITIRENVSPRMRAPLVVLEATGLRVGELIALTWGDLDIPAGRLFVRGGKTRAARRWVPVPDHAMDAIEDQRPREDRDPERAVFPGLIAGSLRMAMRRVSRLEGIPLYSPHDLRHRYISLAIRRGLDPAAVASVVGHTRKSQTLDIYSHLLLEESP
ncbi:hypothetical protein [Microcystis phage Mae-JY09]